MPLISTCRVCGRGLRNPRSVAVSMGPVCARRFGVIFEEALAYATSIGAQLNVGTLRVQAQLAAQEAYRQRISRRRGESGDQSPAPAAPVDQSVNVWSTARSRDEECEVEFSSEHHARVHSASGHTYDVTTDSCSCPHFTHRLRGSGGICRHIDAFRSARANVESSLRPTEPQARPEIRAIVDRSRHQEALRGFRDINWVDEEEREALLDTWRTNRAFDGVWVHEDDAAWENLQERAEQDWEYKYEHVLGGTGNSFGMEIEFTIPRGVSKEQVAQVLYEEGVLDQPRYYSYHGGYAGPGYWKLETDSSIDPSGLELVSPVLYDRPETWQQIERACTRLKELGCSTNSSCGGHIHVGIAPLDHRTYSWQRLSRIGLAYERNIFRMGGANADQYAQSGRPGVFRNSLYATPLPDTARRIMGSDNAAVARSRLSDRRYSMFNATNIDSHRGRPALEFRYPNSTLNHKQWQAQIQVANAMMHQAAVLRNESPNAHLTPGLMQVDDQLRKNDSCSEDVETDNFRRFLDVLGNDADRLAATWLFKRGRAD